MRDMVGRHCENTDCIILCYALSSRESFRNLDEWLQGINEDQIGRTLPIALVANKSDLETSQRLVTKD